MIISELAGVTFPSPPSIKRWDELAPYEIHENTTENAGREISCTQDVAKQFADQLKRRGIDYETHDPVYYDVDTNQRIDGHMRFLASGILGHEEWRMQGVKFANKRAKWKFALIVNNCDNEINRDNTVADVERAIKKLWTIDQSNGIIITSEWIRSEVESCCEGSGSITTNMKEKLISSFELQLRMESGSFQTAERYISWRRSTSDWLDDLSIQYTKGIKVDPWIPEYWENEQQHTLTLEEYTFNSIVYKLLRDMAEIFKQEAKHGIKLPLSICFSVNPPKKGKCLFDKRNDMFEVFINRVENQLLTLNPMFSRENFPWNHPDAQHRFIPQDSENEPDPRQLVKIKNRGFN